MLPNLGPAELILILAIALLVFGPKKLPEIGRGIGNALREFNKARNDFMETIKGALAHFINHRPEDETRLYWQSGYGALTFARRDLRRIVAYIDNRKTHRGENKLSLPMERCWE